MKHYSFALIFAGLLLYSCGGNGTSNSTGDLSGSVSNSVSGVSLQTS